MPAATSGAGAPGAMPARSASVPQALDAARPARPSRPRRVVSDELQRAAQIEPLDDRLRSPFAK